MKIASRVTPEGLAGHGLSTIDVLCHRSMWLSTFRSMSCVHKFKTVKTVLLTKDVVFVVILRVRGQCTSPSARILEELNPKHKSTMHASWIPLNTAWLEWPGTSARPNLAPIVHASQRQCELLHFGDIPKENTFHISSPKRPSLKRRRRTVPFRLSRVCNQQELPHQYFMGHFGVTKRTVMPAAPIGRNKQWRI